MNHFATGAAPSFLKRYIAGGVSIALEKSATAVRPLACGDPLRRLVAKCFCVMGKSEISRSFAGRNYGVGCKGGVEVVAHSLRDALQKHKDSGMGLLKIDFRNAFNEVNRNHFIKATCNMFPALSAWTEWCYGEHSMLLYDHLHIIESMCGVQQGDPLGPLYFCCGINSLVNEIQALNPTYNKWYMDDGGIIGDVELLKKVWVLLQTKGPALGLHLNASKCEWSWLDSECKLPCPIVNENGSPNDQIQLVPHAEIQMLGVPLGSAAFVSAFVEKKLIGRLQSTVDKLIEFEDTQAASYLLRVSYGIVRAVHFMRTTPLHLWREQSLKFDRMIRHAIERILGFPMDDMTFAQATLTPKLGGLGLRRSAEHAGLAYHASWHESQRTAREVWTPPPGMSEHYVSQSEASFKFDERLHKCLVSDAPNDREAQRLRRCAQPHAGGFITAVPSQEDGRECILKPRNFQIAVAYRLGVRVLKGEITCPLCEQNVDVYGDHATCCIKSSDRIIRHNTLRNLLYKFASEGLLSPELEKQGILGSTTGRRPGDVTLPVWSDGSGLAIDVAVTSPLQKASVRLYSPCEEYAATQKHGKYDKEFKGVNYSFAAMVWESLGAINVEGEEVLRQVFSFTSKKLHREFSSFCGRSWAQFSCCLQRSVSQAILLRVDGQEFTQPVKKASLVSPALSLASVVSPVVTLPPALSLTSSSSVSVSLSPVSLSPAPPPSAFVSVVSQAPLPNVALDLASVPQAFVSGSAAPLVQAVGGVYPIRGDGLCGYHCAAALGALVQEPRALDAGFDCSYEVLAVTRKHILSAFDEWWAAKRVFYTSDAEMEAEEVSVHVDGSSQSFRDRVNGGDKGKKDGLLAWPCDLALYALKTDVLVVLLDTQRLSAGTSDGEGKAFEELWFDPVVESEKKRVVCIVMDSGHFELAVVRTPELRFFFDRGNDWADARRLLLTFVKQRVPGVPLGPKWEPPAGSAFAISLDQEGSFSPCHKAVSSPLSLSSPCRNKAVYPSLSAFSSLSFPPNQANNNSTASHNKEESNKSGVPHNKEESNKSGVPNQVTLVSMDSDNKEISKSGVEKQEREGPIHSDNTLTHMISNRPGAKKKQVPGTGSAKKGMLAQQVPKRGLGTAKKASGVRHYKNSHGEICNTYIPSSSNPLYYNSCSPRGSKVTSSK